jgi:hypothetical protein
MAVQGQEVGVDMGEEEGRVISREAFRRVVLSMAAVSCHVSLAVVAVIQALGISQLVVE